MGLWVSCGRIDVNFCALQGRKYDQKTDVWAIGCMLFELCALRKAFDGRNQASIMLKVMRLDHCVLSSLKILPDGTFLDVKPCSARQALSFA